MVERRSFKNLGLKRDDQHFRISIGLRLGANICVEHACHCGKRVERDGLHCLPCTKGAGRFSRHATLNSLMKQTLGSLDLPSMLGPRGLYRTDGKRPDGVTMIPSKFFKTPGVGCHGCGCSCTQSPESRLFMQLGNHRH